MRKNMFIPAIITILTAIPNVLIAQAPLGADFTYQGKLMDGGLPADGDYDFIFRLYDADASGAQIDEDVAVGDWPIEDGLFTLPLDFGAGAFNGDARWIEISVRDGGDEGDYTTLSPRQPVTSTPYALYSVASGDDESFWEASSWGISYDNVVSIGTSDSDYRYSLYVFNSSDPTVKLQSDGLNEVSGRIALRQINDAGTDMYFDGTSSVEAMIFEGFASSGVSEGAHMAIKRTGGVGIGTIDPQGSLHVVESSVGDNTITVQGDVDGANPNIKFVEDGGVNANIRLNEANDGSLELQTAGATRLTLEQGGFVGVGTADPDYMLHVAGNAHVNGTLSKGGGSFMIDHPLDPENKYLRHSFVESPDMMNIYNGNIVTDERGYAAIALPEWFEALNSDFRYQLTVIDGADSEDFVLAKVVSEIQDNRFAIRSSAPGAKVSWQITGIRRDRYAQAYRIEVEVDKPDHEQGSYLHPEVWGGAPDNLKHSSSVSDAARPAAEPYSDEAVNHD